MAAMSTGRLLIALIVIGATLGPGSAHADGAPPVRGGVECHQEPKRTYRLSQVVRHGMPIKVTCTGPARFFAVPEFTAMTPQDRDLTAISGNGYKAPARVREAELSAAGTLTVRPRFNRFAIRIMRRYRRTKIRIGLGTLREDGSFWSEPRDWSRTVVVR